MNKNIPAYLTPDELHDLIEHLCTPMIRAAVTVMYHYGLRISEVCNMKSAQVNLRHDVIRIKGKQGKTRELTITEGTRQLLIDAMKRPGLMFNVSVRSLRNYIYIAASKSNLGHVHPHMIRHSTATHLLNQNWDLADIKAWMRHETIASTQIYTHVATDRLRVIGNSL